VAEHSVKVIEVVRRRPGMSVEDFQDYWLNTHGPIVSRLPGMQRYVQSHARLGGYRKGDLPFDGIAEVSFASKQELAAIASTPEFAAAKADEPNFIDTDALVEIVVDDVVIKDGPIPADAIKNVEFVHLSTAMTPEDAHAYWSGTHGPIAASIPTMSRYVQSHIRMGAYRGAARPRFDGVALTWWDGIDAMRASGESVEYATTRADEANFLGDPPEAILTTEHVILDRT